MRQSNTLLADKGVAPQYQDLASSLIASTRSRGSWKQTRCVSNSISKVELEEGLDLTLPWDSSKKLNYALALIKRGMKVSSVRNYISQSNTLHRLMGHTPPPEDNFLGMILKGSENIETPGKKVLAITPNILTLLREKLKTRTDLCREDRKMLWCCMTIMFHGALRVNEALTGGTQSLTKHDLVWRNIRIVSEKLEEADSEQTCILIITLPCPKEQKGRKSADIELFQQESKLCPVTAFKNWRSCASLEMDRDLPVFRWANGSAFTRSNLQSFLKSAIGDLETDQWRIGTHGFRAGLVTTLGLMGESQELISTVGRWKSESWQVYTKFGRASRFKDAKRLAEASTNATLFNHRNLIAVAESNFD